MRPICRVLAIPSITFPEGTWVALLEPADLREEGRHYLGRLDDPRGLFTVETQLRAVDPRAHRSRSRRSPADSLEATCHLRIESVERFSGELTKVKAELDSAAAGEHVLIACHNAAEVERLGEVFADTELAQSRAARISPSAGSGRLPPDRRRRPW